jgi:hypothetical protein
MRAVKPSAAPVVVLVSCVACGVGAGTTQAAAGAVAVAAKPAAPCGVAKLAEGRAAPVVPSRAKPAKGLAQEEPTFHTCMTRVTDHAKEGLPDFSRHEYSRRQAFNADNSLILTTSGVGAWYVYDANTPGPPKVLEGLSGDAEPQWHPNDPNLLFWGEVNGGLQLKMLDVRRNSSKVAFDLRGKLPFPKAARAWTKSEGSPSADGRLWGFQVETEDFQILGFAVWDAIANKLVGSRPSKDRPDHVSMSPSGRWFVVSADDGTTAWSPDFKRKLPLHKRSEHSDLAIGANGHDIYVSVDYQHNDGVVFMVDLDTGARTNLFPTYVNGSSSAFHFSGKAFAKPGWVLVSAYESGGPKQWFMDKVFAMELKANPRVYQIAAHHSAVKGNYTAEPHATVNRDFTRVAFNSNWEVAGSSDVDAYVIRLSKGAFP